MYFFTKLDLEIIFQNELKNCNIFGYFKLFFWLFFKPELNK